MNLRGSSAANWSEWTSKAERWVYTAFSRLMSVFCLTMTLKCDLLSTTAWVSQFVNSNGSWCSEVLHCVNGSTASPTLPSGWCCTTHPQHFSEKLVYNINNLFKFIFWSQLCWFPNKTLTSPVRQVFISTTSCYKLLVHVQPWWHH